MYSLLCISLPSPPPQEEQNRGKPNWEHLNDNLHVLITVEDTENRATLKLQRAMEEVKKLLVPVVLIVAVLLRQLGLQLKLLCFCFSFKGRRRG